MSGLFQPSRRHIDVTLAVLTGAGSNGKEGKTLPVRDESLRRGSRARFRELFKQPWTWSLLILGAFLFEQNGDMHRR